MERYDLLSIYYYYLVIITHCVINREAPSAAGEQRERERVLKKFSFIFDFTFLINNSKIKKKQYDSRN